MNKALGLLFVICSGLAAFGQEQWQVHGSVQYGFVVPHNSLMEPLITAHSAGGSVRVVKRVSNRLYSRPYGNPYQGVDFTFINTGNNTQLGKQFSLNFWNQFPINRRIFGAPILDKNSFTWELVWDTPPRFGIYRLIIKHLFWDRM